jgi:hypothetical protein
MVTVRESVFIRYDENVNIVRMELDVGSVEELPSADFMAGHRLYQGSIAHDVSTGAFYAIDSNGTWYNQDGSGAAIPASDDDEPNDNEPENEGDENAESV